jgi:phospholipid/cholesterol/gamma-HCH transport system substrate-binding protein
MNQRSATVKVGLLTIISLTVLVTTVIWLRGRGLAGGDNFEVLFKDVDGLREGAPVQLMGIRVGFIDEVKPIMTRDHKYRVRVKFTVTDPDIEVPKGSYISLEQSGIIGEKYLEVTPPRVQSYDLTLPKPEAAVKANLPVMVSFRDGMIEVGKVVDAFVDEKLTTTGKRYQYQVMMLLDRPGYLPPEKPKFRLVKEGGLYSREYLVLLDEDAQWHSKPTGNAYFTLEEPLRLKEFLEEQLASAQALKLTNEKINQLLSDDTILTIQGTLKNSERLTAEAAVVLGQANRLFTSTSQDLKTLVASTQSLTSSVVAVSNNVNELVKDPELKASIQRTVKSMDASSQSLSELLNDPNLKVILSDTKVTSQNAAELMQYLKGTVVDNNLQGRLNESMTLLNSSLSKLSAIMESLEPIGEDKEAIRGIIKDTQETSENLNKFSERLNKRFLFFRMLF